MQACLLSLGNGQRQLQEHSCAFAAHYSGQAWLASQTACFVSFFLLIKLPDEGICVYPQSDFSLREK